MSDGLRKTYSSFNSLWPKLFELFSRTEEQLKMLLRIFDAHSIKPGDRILDVCCGCGRHSIALGEKGYNALGVDFSTPLIRVAEERLLSDKTAKGKVSFVVGDVRDLHDLLKGNRFHAVLFMTYSIGYYDEEVDESILRQASELADRDGLLVVDFDLNRDYFLPRMTRTGIFAIDEFEVHEYRKFDFEKSRYQPLWKIFRRTEKDLKHEGEISLDLRIYSLHELISLVENAGWEYETAYGNLEMGPIANNSPRITLLAHKTP